MEKLHQEFSRRIITQRGITSWKKTNSVIESTNHTDRGERQTKVKKELLPSNIIK